jgi:hypothetical protein
VPQVRRQALLFFVSVVVGAPAAATPALYLSRTSGSPDPDRVVSVDPNTYTVQGTVFSDPALVDAQGLALGPNGHLYVVSQGTGAILEFDPDSGQLIGTVTSGLALTGGGSQGSELAFGPNGDLYLGGSFNVSGSNQFQLRRYDPATGVLLDTLVGVGPGFAFGPDGLLYASPWLGLDISRYDPDDLSLMDVFASSPLPTLPYFGAQYVSGGVTHLAFASDGTLLAMNEGTFRFFPSGFEGVAGVSAHDPSGALVAATPLESNPYGYFDLAIHPTSGQILSLTDVQQIVEWEFGAPHSLWIGSVGFLNVEMLFVPVPEPAAATLIAFGCAAASLARRRHPKH